ncbi:hypothetical protein ENBRE01_0351 [Enteropsectra breve]|nr:hypothetical protein ENBRE01_0351 [Enteropsectra breve]
MDELENEEDIFVKKIHVLKNTANELTGILRSQNLNLRNIQPRFSATLARLRTTMFGLNGMDKNKLAKWKFYIFTSLIFTLLLVIFYMK